MIDIKNISKGFNENILFCNFSMVIEDNDFIVFSGESGCGKTTLLNMIGGLEKIDSGTIIVDNYDLGKQKRLKKYYREKVGFVFQNFALIEDKTVEYNLRLVCEQNCDLHIMEAALENVGLPNILKNKIYTLSGGEQQRVALARLMIKKCDVVLADEPTGSLDKKNAEHVMDILDKMNSQGKTIILVSHDDWVKRRAKKVIQL